MVESPLPDASCWWHGTLREPLRLGEEEDGGDAGGPRAAHLVQPRDVALLLTLTHIWKPSIVPSSPAAARPPATTPMAIGEEAREVAWCLPPEGGLDTLMPRCSLPHDWHGASTLAIPGRVTRDSTDSCCSETKGRFC